MSSVNVDPVDPHSASIQEILEASRLSKNKDLLQLLGKKSALILTWFLNTILRTEVDYSKRAKFQADENTRGKTQSSQSVGYSESDA